jgi:regulator of replication initiation timing
MPYVSENEKLRRQLEENTKNGERLQAENNRLRKRISTTEEQNRLESVTRAITSNLVTVPETGEQNIPLTVTGETSE